MLARDIMTTPVISLGPDASVSDAIDLMLKNHVSALPVVAQDGDLVGIISEGDLMRRVREGDEPRRSWWLELFAGSGSAQDFIKTRSHRVSDVMTRNVISIEADMQVGEIARILERNRIKRVPVVLAGRAVGIVSRSNLMQALSLLAVSDLPPPSDEDRGLRKRVASAIDEVPDAQAGLMNIIVEGGKVSVWGVADNEIEETAIRVAVENVAGVKELDMRMGRMPAWNHGF